MIGRILEPSPVIPSEVDFREEEVDKVFLKPVQELASQSSARYTQFRVKPDSKTGKSHPGYSLPCYDVEPYRIWGLTAIITYQFLNVFLSDYKHKIMFVPKIKQS